MKIGITGLAGSGKGTVARLLAQEIGVDYVDLGLIFRAASYVIQEKDIGDFETLPNNFFRDLEYIWDGTQAHVLYLAREITSDLYQPQISAITSHYAAQGSLHQAFHGIVEGILRCYTNVIADGRNVGTTILRDADIMFCLCVDARIRAKRRHEQLLTMHPTISYDAVLSEILERDTRDSSRSHAPYSVPEGAVIICNDMLSSEDCVAKMISHILL
jgi:cytidylate kinase